jgi:hypothetical protein
MSGWNPAGILPPDEPVAPRHAPPVQGDRVLAQDAGPSSVPEIESRSADGAQPYSVLVKSYEDDTSLADHAAALEAGGYRVYEIELDLGDSRRRQLLVGRYADVRTAVEHERRLREDPRFADARLIVSTSVADAR